MQKEKNDDDVKDLKLIHCFNCGGPMVRLANGATCSLICNKCKREVVIAIKDGWIIQGSGDLSHLPVTS